MKSILVGLLFFTSYAFAAIDQPIQVRCRTEMSQFKADSRVPVIGDSNQRLHITLAKDKDGNYIGEGMVRFKNDQSQDNTNSSHGAKVYMYYTPGNGLVGQLGVVKFDSKADDSKYSLTTGLGFVAEEGTISQQISQLQLTYMNPNLLGAHADIKKAYADGLIKDYDLVYITIMGCREE